MNWDAIVQEAIIALVPVVALALTGLIGVAFAYLRNRLVWLKQTKVDEQIEEALSNLVAEANQTIVDELKAAREDGKLTEEEKVQIRQNVLLKLEARLTQEQRKILGTITDDVSGYLESKLERLVVEAKLDQAIAKNSRAPVGS